MIPATSRTSIAAAVLARIQSSSCFTRLRPPIFVRLMLPVRRVEADVLLHEAACTAGGILDLRGIAPKIAARPSLVDASVASARRICLCKIWVLPSHWAAGPTLSIALRQ